MMGNSGTLYLIPRAKALRRIRYSVPEINALNVLAVERRLTSGLYCDLAYVSMAALRGEA